ncbi:MAG: hypothetical protein Q4E48_11195 [Prevotella sp.]|nr:hypothetical protein [Prevotella sp.]
MIINANLLPNRILFINTNTNHHVSPVVAVGGVAVLASCKAEDEKTKSKDLKETLLCAGLRYRF